VKSNARSDRADHRLDSRTQDLLVNKRILWNAFQYLLAVGLLALVLFMNWGTPGSNGLGDVWRRHVLEGQPVHWNYLLPGFAIYTIAVFITLLRWYLLVRAQDLQVSLPESLRLGLIGCYYNAFLPGSVGGDIVKAAALARGQERRTVAVATVLMDRVLGLWALAWIAAMFGSVFWLLGSYDGKTEALSKGIVLGAWVIVGVSLAVWVVMGLLPDARATRFAGRLERLPKVGGMAAEMWRAVWLYRRRQMSVCGMMVLSWVSHIGFVTAFYCSAVSLYDGSPETPVPTLAQHFLIYPLGAVIAAAALLPGGIGVGEAGFGGLYKLFLCAPQNGALAMLVTRLMAWTFGLTGFAFYRWQVRRQVVPAASDLPPRIASPASTPWTQSHTKGVKTI
jgi:glycosyltransferase 2 family protein